MSKFPSMGFKALKRMFELLKDATSDLRQINKIKIVEKPEEGKQRKRRVDIVSTDIDVFGPSEDAITGRFQLELTYVDSDVSEEDVRVVASRNIILEPEEVEVHVDGAHVEGADIDVRLNFEYDLGMIIDAEAEIGLIFVIEIDDTTSILVFTEQVEIGLKQLL